MVRFQLCRILQNDIKLCCIQHGIRSFHRYIMVCVNVNAFRCFDVFMHLQFVFISVLNGENSEVGNGVWKIIHDWK